MNPDGVSSEFALVVADEWRHQGIGSQLMTRLMDAARARGFKTMEGEVLAGNPGMLELVRSLGFSIRASEEEYAIKMVTKAL